MRYKLSILFSFIFLISFAQKSKEPYVVASSVSACKKNCVATDRLFVSELKGKTYFFEMQIEANCNTYDTVLCFLNGDTLNFMVDQKNEIGNFLLKYPDWSKLKKGPALFTCICPFDVSIKLDNVISAPRVIKMDDRYWNGWRFGDLESLQRNAWKNWADNSAKLNYTDFKKCIGNSMYTEEFLDLCSKLGNDSIVDYDDVNTISYPLDKIDINFDATGNVVGIYLTEFFRNYPHPVFYIGNTKEKVDKYLGEPQTFEKGQCIDVDLKTGKEIYIDCWYDCYYRNEYIHIRFDKDKKIESITLRF